MTSQQTAEVKQLIRLLREHAALKDHLTASEFAQKKRSEGRREALEPVLRDFVQLTRHAALFDALAEDFWKAWGLKCFSREVVSALMYLVIFRLDEGSYAEIADAFKNVGYRHTLQVVDYFRHEDNLVNVAQAGCRLFENDYVIEVILDPILAKADLIRRLSEDVSGHQAIANRGWQKAPPTKPQGPSLLYRIKERPSSPRPKSQQRPQSAGFRSTQIPDSVYKGDVALEKKLQEACAKNRFKAMELLKRAQEEAFGCAPRQPSKIPVRSSEPSLTTAFKARKPPPKKDVAIRSNAAALMREAAALEREQLKECRQIERALEGGFDTAQIEALEREIRDVEVQEKMQEIERRHLVGLLSREQAKAARKRAAQANRDKFERFRIEQVALMKEFDEWRDREFVKIKKSVEKVQNVEKSVKEAEKRLHVSKQRNAKLVQLESKRLLQEACEAKEREFRRKAELIAEIRALHHVTTSLFAGRRYDPTATANLGLMCEMSVAELQERLALLKLEMEQEVREKQKQIAADKFKHAKALDEMKSFVSETRRTRARAQPAWTPPKIAPSPDIVALREKLQVMKSENAA